MFHLPIVEVLVGIILTVMGVAGLTGLAALMAVESFGIPPLPSEVILLFAGFLVADGTYSFAAAFVAALLGGVAGSFIAYYAGRDLRGWLFPEGRPPRVPFDRSGLERMDRWFARHGEGTVAFARLMPVVRSYISYPAGAARMGVGKFGLYTAIGATPFTLALLYAGVRLGAAWSSILPYFSYLDDAAVAIIAVVLAIGIWRYVLRHPSLARASAAPSSASPPEAGPPPGAAEPGSRR
jgi:membrane protein DedA with SNARE-associated domain